MLKQGKKREFFGTSSPEQLRNILANDTTIRIPQNRFRNLSMNPDIYLDATATAPVLPAAIAAADEAMRATFGNPGSSHSAGLRARVLLEATRARAARGRGGQRAAGVHQRRHRRHPYGGAVGAVRAARTPRGRPALRRLWPAGWRWPDPSANTGRPRHAELMRTPAHSRAAAITLAW
jgi:hypothetical protein